MSKVFNWRNSGFEIMASKIGQPFDQPVSGTALIPVVRPLFLSTGDTSWRPVRHH